MDYLKTLVQEIRSVVVATVDEAGNPHTSVMYMMFEDGQTVYFLTASSKSLFKRLKDDGRASVTDWYDAGEWYHGAQVHYFDRSGRAYRQRKAGGTSCSESLYV